LNRKNSPDTSRFFFWSIKVLRHFSHHEIDPARLIMQKC